MKAVLEESAIPRKLVRRFEPYHEIPDDAGRREAMVTLHEEGWSDKSQGRLPGTGHPQRRDRARASLAEFYRDQLQPAAQARRPLLHESWERLVEEHDLWLERHNTQRHKAHENREDGRRSPSEVLGPVRVVRHHPTDLSRAFFSTMLVRKLDAAGYARVKHWRVYAEEGLARCEVAVWLGDDGLVFEHAGRALSRYDVSLSSRGAKLQEVTNPRLFPNGYRAPQPKLFALDVLGHGGWLKALRLGGYAAYARRRPDAL